MEREHDEGVATKLTNRIGHRGTPAMKKLAGGRNSRTYVLTLENGDQVVLKIYPPPTTDRGDRRRRELTFLAYARELGIKNVATVLASSSRDNATLFSYIRGDTFQSTQTVSVHEIGSMANFLRLVNESHHLAATLPVAAEACFSLEQHLCLIGNRVRTLQSQATSSSCPERIQRIVSEDLVPLWHLARTRARETASAHDIPLSTVLGSTERCVSPSDFGLHNAIIDSLGTLSFLDFEYAGIDDPAKLVCDTLMQPRIPIPDHLRGMALQLFSTALNMDIAARTRVKILWSPYMIKWVCIMLNPLLCPVLAGNSRVNRRFGIVESSAQLEAVLHHIRRIQQSGGKEPRD